MICQFNGFHYFFLINLFLIFIPSSLLPTSTTMTVTATRFYIPGIFEAPHDDPKYRTATTTSTNKNNINKNNNNNIKNSNNNNNNNMLTADDKSIQGTHPTQCPSYHICDEPFSNACFSRIAYCREQFLSLGCHYPPTMTTTTSSSVTTSLPPDEFSSQDEPSTSPQNSLLPMNDLIMYDNYIRQLHRYPCAYVTVYPFLYQNQSINGMRAWTSYVGLRRMAFSPDLRHYWLDDCRNAVSHVQYDKRDEFFLQCLKQNCSPVDTIQIEEIFRERQFVCNTMRAQKIRFSSSPSSASTVPASAALQQQTSMSAAPAAAALSGPSSQRPLSNTFENISYALDEVLGAQMRCVVGADAPQINATTYDAGVGKLDHYFRPESSELISCLRQQGIDYELIKDVHEAPYGYENEFCTGLAGFIRCAYNERCSTEDIKRLVWFGLKMSFGCVPQAVWREVMFTEQNKWGRAASSIPPSARADDLSAGEESITSGASFSIFYSDNMGLLFAVTSTLVLQNLIPCFLSFR